MVFLKKVRKILNMDISDLFKSKSSKNLIGHVDDDLEEGEFDSKLSSDRGFSLKKSGKDNKKLKKGFFSFFKKFNKIELFDLKSNEFHSDSKEDIEIHSEFSQINQSKETSVDVDIESKNDDVNQSLEAHVDIKSEDDEFNQLSEDHTDLNVNIDSDAKIDAASSIETENVENLIEDKTESESKKGLFSFFKNTKQLDDSDKQSTIFENSEPNQNQSTDVNFSDDSDLLHVDDDLHQELGLNEDQINFDNSEETTTSVSDSDVGRLNDVDQYDIVSDEFQDEFLSKDIADSVDSQRIVRDNFFEKNDPFIKSNQVDKVVNKQDDRVLFEGSLIKKGSILSELDQLIVRQHIADEQERKKNKIYPISF